ncbi:TIGR03619 family F420-dependent LLM class oxidoreductase [Amycolatopsis rhabdoformis]|uniref:TIGR03619 family F420-dependent LLM class oxidoreductase n=1 Tax=Amycolatopsis rhabdoformis TaxID=1448059 RepID=A0ABZ1I8N5_9PSEU|nr:TIGR03619 family F420-dependent LLM class oxidoreductase [Amycolatopsis rhabdoformis]WSE30796.1 TIGR03619 family F420-dependent LLM class oxidoreductase [Amycolatopsis rhabdoformis]
MTKFGVASILTDESIGPAALATALEDRSFDALFVGDHSHVPVKRETPFPFGGDLPREYHRELDAFGALCAAAMVTSTLTLGTGVALPAQRDVFYTAKQVATLDRLCGGRFVFGVGVGWLMEVLRDHGVDAATRGARLDEHLRALEALWTRDVAEFHGEFVDFGPVYAWPKPQQARVPIHVGGESVAAVKRAAALGDVWMPNAAWSVSDVHAQFELRDRHAPGIPITAFAAMADNRPVLDEYVRLGADQVVLYLPTLPEAEALAALDELAEVARQYR